MPTPSIQDAKPDCPAGGDWYVCTTGTQFLGCCADNPCQDGCSAGDLRPASYNTTYTGKFSDQQCDAGLFYTCADTTPPFLGCCESNPCVIGNCPQSDLAGAFLSSNPAEAGDFTASLSTTSATSTARASTITSSIIPTSAPGHPHLSIGVIVGIVVGSVVVFLGLAALLMVVCQRRSKTHDGVGTAPQRFTPHTIMAPNFGDSSNSLCISPLYMHAPTNASFQGHTLVHQHSTPTDNRTYLRGHS
jgi:hypothetical protein